MTWLSPKVQSAGLQADMATQPYHGSGVCPQPDRESTRPTQRGED
jgi:hypothetical protein